MQETTALYKRLLAEEHSVEVRLVIGNGSIENGIPESKIFSLRTRHDLFSGGSPTIGCTVAGQIDLEMLYETELPKMAQLSPWIRLVSADGTEQSEWLQKGVYFVDTREITHNNDGLEIIKIHGYDALLKAQADYPSDSAASYPARDTVIAQKIATAMGVTVDERTWSVMTGNYTYGLPVSYSMQEVLSSLAIPYAGNWIITETGELRLVSFADIPKETRYLVDEVGYVLVFGTEDGTAGGDPVRILV